MLAGSDNPRDPKIFQSFSSVSDFVFDGKKSAQTDLSHHALVQ